MQCKISYKGQTIDQVAKKLGVNRNDVYRHLRLYGNIDKLRTGEKLKQGGAKPPKLFVKGKPLSYWANKLGVSRGVIEYHFHKYGHFDRVGKTDGWKLGPRSAEQKAKTSEAIKKVWARKGYKSKVSKSITKVWKKKKS